MTLFYDTISSTFSCESVLLAVIIGLIIYGCIQWSQMTPGPIGLPYLGYYPFLSNERSHKQLKEMSKKYGDVFCFTITGQTYVNLGSIKAMKEALVTKSDCFNRKPQNFNMLMDYLEKGLANESGETWKVLRKFFSVKLKEYGLGKKTQETWLGDCLQRTVDALKNSGGKDFELISFFTENCTVAIRQLLFGPVNVDDDDARKLANAFKTIVVVVSGTRFLLAGPLFKYIMMPLMSDMSRYQKAKDEMNSIIRKIFREHEKEYDKNNIRNLVDCYLDERRTLMEKGDPRYMIYTEKVFVDTVLQIFGDGSTSISALTATLLKLISDHPDVQKKIQSELDEIVGRDRFPSWDEKSRMSYTNAVIYESIRVSWTDVFLPYFPSLECTEETTVGGCRVPKGSILLQNFYTAFRDPGTFDHPERFDPSRYLPNEEDMKIKAELPCIFGMGKRSCLGEYLTSMQTFLFVTTVLQNFDLLPASSEGRRNSEEWDIVIRASPRKF